MNKPERTNLSRRLFHAVMLLIMILSMLTPASAQAAPQLAAKDEAPQGVPPSPRLKDKIKQGKVKLPRHMTDKAWAASVGIEGASTMTPLGVSAPQAAPPTGTVKMLAVAVDFSDNVHTVTASYFDSLLFATPVAGPGSMRDYYSEISYGQIDFVTVNLPSSVGWQRAPQTYAYYVNHDYGEGTYPNNAQKLAEDIFAAIDSVVDFSQYDNNHDGTAEPVVIIHAGQGAESSGSLDDLWSFSWGIPAAAVVKRDGVWVQKFTVQPEYADVVTATTSDQTMGVYAHEVAHGFFGVPDTYDTDYTSNGVGDFDLMAGGSWGGPNGGDVPAWPSAWIRKQMGIVTPVSITANAPGRSIAQVYNNNVDPVLKLSSSALGSQEYFLVENRQKATGTYDQYIPAGGLLIWHIDESMTSNTAECSLVPQSSCSDTAHYRVALMQADGLFDMEKKVNEGDAGDPFPGSTNNRNWATSTVPETSSYYAAGATCINVTNISNPAATMTADLRVICNATNTPPVAVNDSYTTAKNTAVTIAMPGVLKNDTDVDWNLLTTVKVADPAHGTVTFNANGSFTYTPTANWFGTDSFTYRANDGTADSNVATVTMTVLDTGMVALSSDTSKCMTVIGTDPTTAPYMTMSTCVGTPQQLWTHDSVSGVWRTALNPNYCLAANSITTTRLNLRLCSDSRALTLEPNPTETGSWRAVGTTYVIDLTRWLFGGVSYPALSPYTTNRTSEVLTWLPGPIINTAPVASNDSYSANEDTPLTIAAPGVLSNDTDAESNPLTAVKVSDPAHGSLTLNANGSFTYTPAAHYSGADSFTYKANDGSLDSNTATVDIKVTPNEYTLTVNSAHGTVTKSPNKPTYHYGEEVTLSVASEDGWTFTGWTPPLTANKVTIAGNTTITANFTQNEYTLTVLKVGNGTVTRDNNGPYHLNDVVTLTAVADAGWTFTGWTPSLTDNKVTITDNITVTANFTQNEYTLTVLKVGNGTVTRDNNGPYHLNDVVTLTAVADAGWTFTGWTPALMNNKVTITGDTIVTANFVVSNTAPVATNDNYITNEDTALTVAAPGVLGNDTDVDGNALTAVLVDGPLHGTLTLNANGSFTYTPGSSYYGTESFTYKANDGAADSNMATVSITVNHVNHAPLAIDDTASTTEGTAVTVNVLNNDSDPDGDNLSVTSVGTPAHGSVVINPDYTLTYTPASLFNGTDEFTYAISDGHGGTATAKVTVTVGAVNDAPTAGNDIYATNEDTQLTIAAPGVLSNDADPDGDAITAVLVTNVGHGTLVLHANGSLTYTPSANFNGSDSFTYKANDGQADSSVATVSITVNPINDVSVANSQSLSVDEDNSLAITLTGNDVDGDALTFSVIANPAHGTLSGTTPALAYTPNANFNGTDNFIFKVSDGFLEAQAQINITVNPINDAPVAVLDAYETDENAPLNVPAPGVLTNDTDVDGDALTAVLVSSVSHGTLVFNSDGSFIYTPEANFNGEDSFTYMANDGVADSNGVTGTIKIHVVNYPPSASNDAYTTDEDTALTIAAAGVLGNDTDADGDTLSALKATDPSHGTLTLNADGSFTYIPAADWYGTDTFTYKATDGIQESHPAEVNIVVKSINDAPIAAPQTISLDEDTQKAIPLSGSDVDGDTLTYTIVSMPANGVLSGAAPYVSYTPNANFFGDDFFTFTVNDGNVTSDPATVNIHVNSVNDAPVCLSLSLTTDEDTASTLSPSCTDVDNMVLSYQIVTPAGHGTASISGGLLAYSPDANYNGADAFTYKANDGVSDSNTANVAVTVYPINDAPGANNQSVTTDQNTPKAISLSGSDVEDSPLTITIVTGPTHGSLSGTAPSITYTPASGYSGSDSFTFKLNDGALDSNIATVSITVAASNHAPVAVNDSYSIFANTPLTITAPGVLSNDTDADNEPLTAVKVTGPAHGTLTLNANGSFTYTPTSGYVGSDSFTYKVNDGKADSNTATVSIRMKYNFTGFFQPVDNAPVENQMKAGASVPIKFSLGGNMGLNIFASGYPTVKAISCVSGVPVDDIEQTTNSNSGLTYDAVAGQYIYTWKTDKKLANTCQQFTLRLIDGTEIIALFKFK